ncbi:hypothetical protein HXX01_03565 [Candidatus Nomurabacteria bacterium]|nr:hypothetical protein [Candidatus Nomurabacteria bacterium]
MTSIGATKLGLWSLIMASTSITQITNLGISGSVVKFVAKYHARNELHNISLLIQTSLITIAIVSGSAIILLYPFFKILLTSFVDKTNITDAYILLPYAMLSLWLNMIGSIYQSAVDGLQKVYAKNVSLTICQLIHLVTCFTLIPTFGIFGLIVAQLGQNLLVLFICMIITKKHVHELPIIPILINKNILKEIIPYGAGFQLISISQLLCDPVTKTILSKFGGLGMVAYFEMASKIVLQFRAIIINSNQVLVPTIAYVYEKTSHNIRSMYQLNYDIVFYISVPVFSLLIGMTPVISVIWLGRYTTNFVLISLMLIVSSFINLLSGPAYFSNLGTGKIKWNLISHIIIAIVNLVFGILLGFVFGGYGVILAWCVALSAGSYLLQHNYNKEYLLNLSYIVPTQSRLLFILSIVSSGLILLSYYYFEDKVSLWTLIILSLFIFIVFVLPMFWKHPLRKFIYSSARTDLIKKEFSY